MPATVTDPFGTTLQACSISTAVKAKFGKDKFPSEAAWAVHVKKDAFNTLRAKVMNGELPKNTILARAPGNMKLKLAKNDAGNWRVQTLQGTNVIDDIGIGVFDQTAAFKDHDWDFGPNMAKLPALEKAGVNSPAKLKDWLDQNDNSIDYGHTVATVSENGKKAYPVKYDDWDDVLGPQYSMDGPYGKELLDTDGLTYYHKSPNYHVEYKVGQVDLPPANGMPVSSVSTSQGALTNEDAAAMFVKTKDKLAAEAGLNIKAAGKIDEMVYKTIGAEAGYTPLEMKAKVDAYKASGKKLSALKKKVLPKDGQPTKVATQKAVDDAVAAVKATPPPVVEVPQVWDEEAVAKAYIKAKDHVVANNNHGWTLYTKNPDFDKEIHKWMQADLGPIPKQTADTAVANYIANTQKLSVLKKQMIKKGELTPQADTLKAKKAAGEKAADDNPAPGETGAGQVGKASEDPTKIGPKQTLTEEQEHQIFLSWEGMNLPIASHGSKLHAEALNLAKQYDLGDDVLPILRAVDKGKTKKFGLAPEQNKFMYEIKVKEHLKNPTPPPGGYTPPPPPKPAATYGELPEDSGLFQEISPQVMTELAEKSMVKPTGANRQALVDYSGSYYHDINSHLRAGGSMTAKGQLIQDAMSPLPRDIIVKRGTSLKGLGMQTTDQLSQSIGKTFREPAFSSTAVGGTGQFSGEVNLIIQAPKGTKAAWLKPFSNFSNENELLLAAGTRFKILKVEQQPGNWGSTRNVVHVRVVP